jgi:hypothetical protein
VGRVAQTSAATPAASGAANDVPGMYPKMGAAGVGPGDEAHVSDEMSRRCRTCVDQLTWLHDIDVSVTVAQDG